MSAAAMDSGRRQRSAARERERKKDMWMRCENSIGSLNLFVYNNNNMYIQKRGVGRWKGAEVQKGTVGLLCLLHSALKCVFMEINVR